MRPCVSVDDFTSIAIAIERMRESGQELVPIVRDERVLGVLTEAGILRYVAEGAQPTASIIDFLEPASIISNRATGAEALRQLENRTCLVVVDDHMNLCGLISPSNFVGTPPEQSRPHMVGGMATPFGVYLTSGAVSGGKSGLYLVSTGFFLLSILSISGCLVELLERRGLHWLGLPLVTEGVSFLVIALVFRLHPIAGYHAAEHQVVHAIERDEALTLDVVKRMPRVHPRCGTNLAVALTMVTTLTSIQWTSELEPRLAIAAIITIFFWRPVGSFVQYWITTKKPSEKQLASGIEAGRQLLEKYQVASNRTSGPWQRLFNSGILHVMSGSFLALGIWSLIAWLTGLPFP